MAKRPLEIRCAAPDPLACTRCDAVPLRLTAFPAPAFTLLELVVTLAILTVVAALAVPRVSSAAQHRRADAAARRLAADLNLARAHAEATRAAVAVVFKPTLERYTLIGVTPLDRGAGDYVVELDQDPYRVQLLNVFGGTVDLTLTYDGFGVPDQTGTITVGLGDNQRSVTLDPATHQAGAP